MRSVSVVLPASMWAMMPMFRYRSIRVVRDIKVSRARRVEPPAGRKDRHWLRVEGAAAPVGTHTPA
jgi:hypothetical protein